MISSCSELSGLLLCLQDPVSKDLTWKTSFKTNTFTQICTVIVDTKRQGLNDKESASSLRNEMQDPLRLVITPTMLHLVALTVEFETLNLTVEISKTQRYIYIKSKF